MYMCITGSYVLNVYEFDEDMCKKFQNALVTSSGNVCPSLPSTSPSSPSCWKTILNSKFHSRKLVPSNCTVRYMVNISKMIFNHLVGHLISLKGTRYWAHNLLSLTLVLS